MQYVNVIYIIKLRGCIDGTLQRVDRFSCMYRLRDTIPKGYKYIKKL